MLNAIAGAENYGLYSTAFRGASLPHGAAATANGNLSLYADSVEISAAAQQWVAEHDAAPTADLHTKDGRAEQAKNYDAILAGLRDQYAEPEAMRRFDEIMRADGFAVKEAPRLTLSNTMGGMDGVLSELLRANSGQPQSSLTAVADIWGAAIDGRHEISAVTNAVYRAANSPAMEKFLDNWRNRQNDELQTQVDFDLREYLDAADAQNNAAAGVSSDLATLAADLLKRAGVTLAEGGYVRFSFGGDDSGNPALNAYVVGGGEGASERVNDLVENSGALYRQFKQVSDQIAYADLAEITGYDEGARYFTNNLNEMQVTTGGEIGQDYRSTTYRQIRNFTFAAGQPDAVVISDNLWTDRVGYTYQKKIADEFNPQADTFTINLVNPATEYLDYNRQRGGAGGSGGFYEKVVAPLAKDMAQMIRGAMASGETVKSTMSREDMTAWRNAVTADYRERMPMLAPVGREPEPEEEEELIWNETTDRVKENNVNEAAAKNRRNDLTNYLITDFPAVADFSAQHANQRNNIKSMVLEAVFGRQFSAAKNYGIS
ncbi:hypothetical protein AGMMS49959_04410 [Planctomycetales bacterium]|nr:hypothetical protein AGMMS49959_04410 [Planctomycetales bacterium]